MPKASGLCPQCGRAFEYFSSCYRTGKKIYCSRECQKAACRIETTCPQCGKVFWYHRSWPRKFCSRACSAAVNAKANLGITELPDQYCEMCGKKIEGLTWADRRFCSRRCFGDHLAKTLKGKPRPEVAGERPDLQKRVTKHCDQCGKAFRVKQSHADRRRFCSKSCMAIWQSESGEWSGENSPAWRGGPMPYYGPNWRPQRRNARRRDSYTCRRCGKTEQELGRQLDVHHIEPFRTFGLERYREANRLQNLISYCHICHLLVRHEP